MIFDGDSHETLSFRILGFSDIYSSSCDNGTDIRVIEFNDSLDLDHYINPIALVLCYFVVTITSRVLLGPQVISCAARSKFRLLSPDTPTSPEPPYIAFSL